MLLYSYLLRVPYFVSAILQLAFSISIRCITRLAKMVNSILVTLKKKKISKFNAREFAAYQRKNWQRLSVLMTVFKSF